MISSSSKALCRPCQRATQFSLALLALLAQSPAFGQNDEGSLAICLQEQVLLEVNNNRTVADLRATCRQLINPVASAPDISNAAQTIREIPVVENSLVFATADNTSSSFPPPGFFQPYKKNYLIVGAMRNKDDTPAFSGNNFDMKFELGMMFSLIPNANNSSGALPLHFGYSQIAWWDISEDSAPFQELNYNPEMFYDFAGPDRISTPDFSRLRNLLYIDRLGLEHQSNGLNDERSRSWDRAYVQREFVFSEVLSFNVKLWKVLDKDRFNDDITDYLGNLEITTQVNLNNFAEIELKTLHGRETSKISYQLDITLPMSNWVNSKFFLSYYDGYGEALINYNKRSKSLRAGFHFPLRTLGL